MANPRVWVRALIFALVISPTLALAQDLVLGPPGPPMPHLGDHPIFDVLPGLLPPGPELLIPDVMPGGACGLFARSDPAAPIHVDLVAKATGPFAVELSWSGRAGAYEIISDRGSFHASTWLGPIAWFRPPGDVVMKGPNTKQDPAVYSTVMVHQPAFPETTYHYVIAGTTSEGRKACGEASVKTMALPKSFLASGQYLDVTHVALLFSPPPYLHDVEVIRPDGSQAARLMDDKLKATGGAIPAIVDPGAPPFPYVNGLYQKAPAAYDLTLVANWVEAGSGATRTVSVPIHIMGPPPVVGFADLHAHQFAYLGFGGDPKTFPMGRHMFGKAFGPIDQALPHDDDPAFGTRGMRDFADAALKLIVLDKYGQFFVPPPSIAQPHGGFPEFDSWPRWDSFTHQQMYEDWLFRAHQGGLKLMVTHAVNNENMCMALNSITEAQIPGFLFSASAGLAGGLGQLAVTLFRGSGGPPTPDCRDDVSMENQTMEAFAMQTDIDNRAGGPGLGWYRIVMTPQQARDAIAAGKLAVVLGMEVDYPFECTPTANCTASSVSASLQHFYDLGVRHFFPVHFSDNAFGGTAISNSLNQYAGSHDCRSESYNDQCNNMGLTPLGKTFIRQLMAHGMIIDVDHLSARAFNDTMAIVTPTRYPVVSGHTGFTEIARDAENNEGNRTPAQVTQILGVGGMFAIIPHQGKWEEMVASQGFIPYECGNSSESVLQAYVYALEHVNFGPVGLGTDFNGFAGWPGPRYGRDACPGGKGPDFTQAGLGRLPYPFRIRATGVDIPLDHQVSGDRTYDFNEDGLDQVGLLPDMIADLETMGLSPTEMDPLFFSAEGYIRIWERATYLVPH